MVLVLIIILSASLCQCRNISSEFPVLTVTGDNDNVVPTVLAPLLVSTRLGMLRGMSLKTSNERKTVSAFLGIPFARPPVGELRFRPPVEPLPWSGVRNAVDQPNSCYQQVSEGASVPAIQPSEDCLYLNVFVPDLLVKVRSAWNNKNGSRSLNSGLPVMVWIHGGKFDSGSSLPRSQAQDNWISDPRELASSGEIIVVTVQYRLGPFGFLFLDDPRVPGNVGILDQKSALEWVQDNIVAFGGDPESVTLAGAEAGGVSALLQGSSLFHRLIIMSAGVKHPWSFNDPEESFRRALKLASLLSCPTSGSKDLVLRCLINRPADDISKLDREVLPTKRRLLWSNFVTTVEDQVVPMDPKKMLQKLSLFGRNISVLIGSNAGAGQKDLKKLLPLIASKLANETPAVPKEVFEEALHKIFPSASEQVLEVIKYQFTNWLEQDDVGDLLDSLEIILDESQYECPVDEVATELAKSFPVYRYKFSVTNDYGAYKDDFFYLFGKPLAQSSIPERKLDVEISKFVMRTFSHFVKTGDPNVRIENSSRIGWPKFSNRNRYVLKIENPKLEHRPRSFVEFEPSIEIDKQAKTCSFWNHLVPKLDKKTDELCKTMQEQNELDDKRFLPIKVLTTTHPKFPHVQMANPNYPVKPYILTRNTTTLPSSTTTTNSIIVTTRATTTVRVTTTSTTSTTTTTTPTSSTTTSTTPLSTTTIRTSTSTLTTTKRTTTTSPSTTSTTTTTPPPSATSTTTTTPPPPTASTTTTTVTAPATTTTTTSTTATTERITTTEPESTNSEMTTLFKDSGNSMDKHYYTTRGQLFFSDQVNEDDDSFTTFPTIIPKVSTMKSKPAHSFNNEVFEKLTTLFAAFTTTTPKALTPTTTSSSVFRITSTTTAPTSTTTTSVNETNTFEVARKTTGTTYQTTSTTTTNLTYKPTSTSTTTTTTTLATTTQPTLPAETTPVEYFPLDIETENSTGIQDRYSLQAHSKWSVIKESISNHTQRPSNTSNDYFSLLKPAHIYTTSSTARDEDRVEKLSFEDSKSPFERFLETIRYKATANPPTFGKNEPTVESTTLTSSDFTIIDEILIEASTSHISEVNGDGGSFSYFPLQEANGQFFPIEDKNKESKTAKNVTFHQKMWSYDETSVHDDDIVYDALVQPILDTSLDLTTEDSSFPVQSLMQVGPITSKDLLKESPTTTVSNQQQSQSEEESDQEVLYYEDEDTDLSDDESDHVHEVGVPPGSRDAQGVKILVKDSPEALEKKAGILINKSDTVNFSLQVHHNSGDSHSDHGDSWTLYNSPKSGNSPILINLEAYKNENRNFPTSSVVTSTKNTPTSPRSASSKPKSEAWYKGTPMKKPVYTDIYDPFELQMYGPGRGIQTN